MVAVATRKVKLGALLKQGLPVTVSCSEACRIAAVLTQAATRKRAHAPMRSAGEAAARAGRRPSTHLVRPHAHAKTKVIGRGIGQLAAAGKAKVA